MKKFCFTACLSLAAILAMAQIDAKLKAKLDQQVKDLEPKIIEWRRYFHEHPELSNSELQTGERIANQLKELGLKFNIRLQKQEL